MANAEKRYHEQVLKSKQETFELEIKRFEDFLHKFQNSNMEEDKLRKQQSRLQELFRRFNEDQIEREKFEDVETVEYRYHNVNAKANIILANLRRSETVASDEPGPSTSGTYNKHLREVAEFDGNQKKWPMFKEKLVRFFNENSGLSDNEKLMLLRSKLSEKLNFVMLCNSANFNDAWDMLKRAYDNTFEFKMDQASELINAPDMEEDSPQSFQDLVSHIKPPMRWLDILARSGSDTANILLVSLAMTKMHPETRARCKEFLLQNPQSRDIKTVLNHLSHEICSQSLSKNTKVTTRDKPETSPQKSTADHTKSATKRTGESISTFWQMKRQRPFVRRCYICGRNGHYSSYCQTLIPMTTAERKSVIQQANLCENCLRGFHETRNCASEIRCRKCDLKHHTLLHEQNDKKVNKSL